MDRVARHQICVDGLEAMQAALGYVVYTDATEFCDGLVDYAMANYENNDDRIDYIMTWISGMAPIGNSSCFEAAGACYAGCATLPTATARSLCGLDCAVDILGCIGGELDLFEGEE